MVPFWREIHCGLIQHACTFTKPVFTPVAAPGTGKDDDDGAAAGNTKEKFNGIEDLHLITLFGPKSILNIQAVEKLKRNSLTTLYQFLGG